MSGTFGRHLWALPALELPFPMGPDRFRLFARALLAGEVCPALSKFVPHLKNQPAIMTKPWVKERTVALLQPLIASKVDSRALLLAKWTTDRSCQWRGVGGMSLCPSCVYACVCMCVSFIFARVFLQRLATRESYSPYP